ncbi:MAG: FmdB family zinc ribbon protein [Acidimicrobiia bacterium]
MPTYEYLCKNCGERFEKAQSFSARPMKKHASCGGELQKIFHASGVVFKGSGFYATDSRPGRASADSDSSGTTDSKDSKDSKDSTPKKSDGTKKDAAPKKESKPKTSTPSSSAAAD